MIGNAMALAAREIRRNLLRSGLTALGIIIGVAAVIALVTLGSGAQSEITSGISSLGSNMLIVAPGARSSRGMGGVVTQATPFELNDVDAIAREVGGAENVAPVASAGTVAVFGNANWPTSITGTSNEYLTIGNWELALGRSFEASEERAGRAVCLIGATVREKLFGALNPIGSTIRLGKFACQVIGVLRSKGQSAMGGPDQDDLILTPIRTFQRRISGNQNVQSVFVSAVSESETDRVKLDIEALLRERRRIRPGDASDFDVRSIAEIAELVQSTTGILTTFLAAIAGISLLVGGIGIMNIMLVSVTERTREIGIRLAIGALENEVLTQFLVEAALLSSLGGVVGIVLGLGISAIAARGIGIPFTPDYTIVGIAFVFSAFVGLIFGFFPARRAARLNPIDALRHE